MADDNKNINELTNEAEAIDLINRQLEVILLAEDEEDHARLIQRALCEGGRLSSKIIWVNNGEEAINFVKKKGKYCESTPSPNLIILDVKMPMKNGFEVLKELKTDAKYRTIPIVMLTTTSNVDDIKLALELGANDYIIKPIRFADFINKVKNIGNYWAAVSDSNIVSTKNN